MSQQSPEAESPATGAGFAPLIRDYRVPGGRFDEMLDASGELRPQWREFTEAASELNARGLSSAARHAAHQIHEHGVTYNLYDESSGPARPWNLDVLPQILTAEEWTPIERGLRQRARLLDAAAADLYGPQRLIAERVVPATLLLNHPGFLRPCHGVQPPGGTFVHFVAFDLSRAPDGRWHVSASRLQAPSGLGYALENRAIIARLFPDAARTLGTRPLTPFFNALQDALLTGAPTSDETPLAVLLTPGRFSETYFEHAYLTRELGIPLVEGGDLTVRQDRVFLKTVSGLHPVHSIWRRVDDDYCDPLELRSDSRLGVPGLVQAWRSGHVLVANAFGLSALEGPALTAYLPAACARLLGEPLEIPSVPSWWYGDASIEMPALDDMVIRSAGGSTSIPPVFVASLNDGERQGWNALLAETPEAYTLQSFLPLSHAPVWREGAIASRAVSVRVFLLADGRGDYIVMPGGLCRVAREDRQFVSTRRGGSSKDTWVTSGLRMDPVPADPARPRSQSDPHAERALSSRSAESLFWLGRYAERSENNARLLRAILRRIVGTDAWPERFHPLLVRTAIRHDLLFAADLPADADDPTLTVRIERALVTGIYDRTTRRSLRFNIEETVRVAESVRERLSSDNWRVLQRLPEQVRISHHRTPDLHDAIDLIDDVILSLVAAGGLEMAHMTRDDGWRFLSLGRHLERLAYVAATVHAVEAEGGTEEPLILEWLLDLSDSLFTYRARHLRRPEWSSVAELLFLDERNPRSAMFQVGKLAKHVRLLPDANLAEVLGKIDRVQAFAAASSREQGQLFDADTPPGSLAELSEQVAHDLSDALTLRYFSHVYARQQAVVAR